jgi:hypothetical protein
VCSSFFGCLVFADDDHYYSFTSTVWSKAEHDVQV